MLKYAVLLIVMASLSTSPLYAQTCPYGGVYDRESRSCVHSLDPAEAQRISPDRRDDPKCYNKPAGYRYDEDIIGPNGQPGISHRVCGTRPR